MREELDVVDKARVEVVGGDKSGEDSQAWRFGSCRVGIPVVLTVYLGVATSHPADVVAAIVTQGTRDVRLGHSVECSPMYLV